MSKPSSRRQQLEKTKRITWKQTLRWIALPFVVILLAIVGVKYLFTQQVAAWFDDSWHYRTAQIISNTGSAINEERKIKVEVDTAALSTAGKMQADCDDARFTTQTGEQLEYFIDTATGDCDTNSTDFYVKVPSVIAGDQTLFLYYGNPSAASQLGNASEISALTEFIPAASSAQSEEVGEAPIASWSFDEDSGSTVYDDSSNQSNGTMYGPTRQTSDQCISGKCLYFDGTNDNVHMGNLSSLNFSGTKPFTFSAWVKTNSIGSQQTIFSKFNAGVAGQYFLAINSSGYLTIHREVAPWQLIGSTELEENKWYYVSAVYDGSSMSLYLDGKLEASPQSSGSLSSTSTSTLIGAFYDSGNISGVFNGFIDEVKVYPYARTARQIKADYAARGGTSGATAQIGSANLGQSLSDGLVAYYPMDETAANTCSDGTNDTCDASGNGNDVAWSGDATSGGGKYGNGTTFDGTGDYALDSDGLNDFSDQITISAWINPAALGGSRKTLVASENEFKLDIETDNKIRFLTGENWGSSIVKNNTALSTDTWYHIVAVYNGTSKKIYLNGIQDSIDKITSGSIGNSTSFYLGNYTSSGGLPYPGSLDEVRIYNRALSPAEVTALYEWAPGPVAHWELDEGTGTSTADATGNGNTGALTNGPTWITGVFGGGLLFDGTDDYVDGGDIGFLPAFTVSTWANPTDGSLEDKYYALVARGATFDSNTNYSLSLRNKIGDANPFRLAIYYQNASSIHGGEFILPEDPEGKWSHYSVSYDGTTLKAYYNGTFLPPVAGVDVTPAAGPTDGSQSVTIGIPATTDSNDEPFPGKMDDVQIHNYALSQEQVRKVMSQRQAGDPTLSSSSSSETVGQLGQPVLHMSFEEGAGTTTYDTSRFTHTGTLTSMASPATATSGWTNNGKVGKALAFDGSDDFVTIPDHYSFDIVNELTVSAWVRTSSHTSSYREIVRKGTGWFLLLNNSNKLALSTSNTFSEYGNGYAFPADNEWHLATATFDGSTIRIYLDGRLVYSYAGGALTSNSDPLRIGASESGLQLFPGGIDEVKVYNYALSEADVMQEYNAVSAASFGSKSTESDGATYTQTAAREYCPPSDISSCDAPVAEFKLDEGTGTTANDTSGNANSGTLTNSPTWTQGKFGKAVSFDGSDDYISIGTGTIPAANKSISAWVKLPSVGSGSGTTYDYFIAALSGSDYLYFNDGSEIKFLNGGNDLTYTYPLDDNQWHLLTYTYNGTNQYLYVDGVEVVSGTGANTASGSQYIGGESGDSSQRSWLGLIDQVRIYDYARTPAQIAWEYNRGAPVAWYKFDECQGTTINDWSQNGNGDFNGNTGTLVVGGSGTNTSAGTCQGSSGQAWADGAAGKYNGALEFDGVDDYAQVASTDLQLQFPVTYTFWVKPEFDAPMLVFNNDGSDTTAYTGLGVFLHTNGNIEALIGNNTGSGSSGRKSFRTSTSISESEWTQVSVIFNSISDTDIYFNGLEQPRAVSGSASSLVYDGGNAQIGREITTANYYYKGLLDDLRVYNYALTPVQLREVYNGGAAVRFD